MPDGSMRHREHFIPPQVAESLRIGAFAGTFGVLVGATTGVVRGRRPGIHAIIAGIQWFTIAATYSVSKAAVTSVWGGEQRLSNMDKIQASTIAGGCAGAASGLIGGGSRNMIPGALVFSLLGAGGQATANSMAERSLTTSGKGWLASKWSPVTPLTDQEYEKMLEDKILKVDVEIALIDDKIASLKAAELSSKMNTTT